MPLSTTFKNEILQEGEQYRKYDIVNDKDEVVQENIHLVRKDTPIQYGSPWDAREVNQTNAFINGLESEINDLETEINKTNDYTNHLQLQINQLKSIKWILKGDFATLSRSMTIPASSTSVGIPLQYPSGFTKDNCTVVSLMIYTPAPNSWYTTGVNNQYINANLNVVLAPNGITVFVDKATAETRDYNVTVRVVLMKI